MCYPLLSLSKTLEDKSAMPLFFIFFWLAQKITIYYYTPERNYDDEVDEYHISVQQYRQASNLLQSWRLDGNIHKTVKVAQST